MEENTDMKESVKVLHECIKLQTQKRNPDQIDRSFGGCRPGAQLPGQGCQHHHHF